MYKILLIGATGQIGFELLSSLAPLGTVIAPTRKELDLSRPESLSSFVEAVAPDVIVNPAAYTTVDQAESDIVTATAVNATAVESLAQTADQIGALLIHYSTDYVFDGTKEGWYDETDEANPRSIYGKTKYQGEQLVRQHCPRHLIFRTSWVFGVHGSNFAKTILRLAKERDQLNVVADQWGAPCPARLVAEVSALILAQFLLPKRDNHFPFGTYHLTTTGETCWHQYAQEIVAFAISQGMLLKLKPNGLLPIPTSAYPLPALRPLNSRLNTEKLRRTFGLELPNWKQALFPVLQTLVDLSTSPSDK